MWRWEVRRDAVSSSVVLGVPVVWEAWDERVENVSRRTKRMRRRYLLMRHWSMAGHSRESVW